MLDRVTHRAVRVAHALRQSGGAGAEHEQRVGVEVVVAVNRFKTDTEAEMAAVREASLAAGAYDAVVAKNPHDGRYGNNPNRLQHYYQFQVVMKPSPSDFQELYLGSLRSLGIDTAIHDVRFVEDNWESPTLGAWGLGWEVWLNGMEVTQFTYFQQVGGLECYPVTGEITACS